jgi:RNA polymerase sigma-70 factor (ECF subfamily)
MDDNRLVASYLATGDPEYFRALVVRHQQRAFHLAASLLGPYREADAEDVAQDALLEAHSKLSQFRGDAAFSTWLYRIVWNRTADVRARARFRLPHLPADSLLSLADAARGPEAEAAAAEMRERVARALESLPEQPRTLLYLYYWMESSVADISAILDMPQGTVKSYLARARAQFEEAYGNAPVA